ncbi:MAG: hypothetical protein ACLRM8_00970 [Alistipes sp.]
MGGVVTAITFDKPFFDALEARSSQATRAPRTSDARHDSGPHVDLLQGQQLHWTKLTDMAHMIGEMDKSQTVWASTPTTRRFRPFPTTPMPTSRTTARRSLTAATSTAAAAAM